MRFGRDLAGSRAISVLLKTVLSTAVSVLFIPQAYARTPRTAQQFFDRGLLRLYRGEHSGAASDFTQAIELATHLGGAKVGPLADQWKSTKDTNTTSDGVRVIDPKIAPAYADRGLARYRMGDLAGALADYEEAISLNPRVAETYLDRGVVLHAMGDS